MKWLLIVNGVVFLLSALMVKPEAPNPHVLSGWFGMSGARLLEGFGLGVLRLISYQFVHGLGVGHIFMNMLILYFFGTFVEAELGRRRFIWLYLVSGVVGGFLFLLLSLVMGSTHPVIGASGSVYGILMYAAFMAPRMRVILIVFPIELRFLVGFLIFVGVYQTFMELRGMGSDRVAHSAHLGGALWGFLAFKFLRFRPTLLRRMPWDWVGRWFRERQARAGHKRQEVLDRLLEKVHQQGLNSLTSAERRFLDRASKDLKK